MGVASVAEEEEAVVAAASDAPSWFIVPNEIVSSVAVINLGSNAIEFVQQEPYGFLCDVEV